MSSCLEKSVRKKEKAMNNMKKEKKKKKITFGESPRDEQTWIEDIFFARLHAMSSVTQT